MPMWLHFRAWGPSVRLRISVELGDMSLQPMSTNDRLSGSGLPSTQLISLQRHALQAHSVPQLWNNHTILLFYLWLFVFRLQPETKRVVQSGRNNRAKSLFWRQQCHPAKRYR
jgi:hypothetical protein